MPSSAERRVTVNGSVYPKLKELAERDGLTVADVTNAILLQTIRPYGAAPAIAPLVAPPVQQHVPDPYQASVPDTW